MRKRVLQLLGLKSPPPPPPPTHTHTVLAPFLPRLASPAALPPRQPRARPVTACTAHSEKPFGFAVLVSRGT